MDEGFFDQTILEQKKKEPEKTISNIDSLIYHIKEAAGSYFISFEINNQRLNASEISLILTNHKEKLNNSDYALLSYISHRLGMVQTMYKIFTDIELIFGYLQEASKPIYFNDKHIKFQEQNKPLSLQFSFDENSNIVLSYQENGQFLYGVDQVYFIGEDSIAPLPQELPVKFYREVFGGKNKFSLEMFLELKETLLPKLENSHNVGIDEEIKKISELESIKKVAPVVLEVGKTNHFITTEFKYKIGEELYPVGHYKYAETINWLDKPEDIKTVKEGDTLVTYKSNLELSEEMIRDLFEGTRIRPSFSSKSPFLVMLQISYLEQFIKKLLPKAEEMYEIVYKNGEKLRLADGNVKFEIETNLQKRIDLFEFNVKFKIEDEYFDLDFLKNLMQKNRKYVQLKDGTTVNIENIREINKWIDFLTRYEFKKQNNKYRANSQTALELDEFLKDFQEKNITSNEEYRNIIQEMKEKKPIEALPLPETIGNKLRDYQKEGVYWMNFLKKYGFGGILADEMGLGKTFQALTMLKMNQDGTHIVICPKTLIYNWESEVKKFFPEMSVLIIDGTSEKREKLIKTIATNNYDLVITSYSMLQKDYAVYMNEKLQFDYKILDEAHYVKNMKTLSAKAVRLISGKNSILLTGTPLENNLDELYGTFELIMPGYLGSKLDFKREFVSKIERNNTIALEILQAKIRPFILRRTKKEVLKELPDKQEQIVYNEMTNKQVAIYNEVLQRVKTQAYELVEKHGWEKSKMEILSGLLKLRQVCNHPQLIDNSFKDEKAISGKHEQFLELLEEVIESGEKVLVFSQFTSMLDIFEKDLQERGISSLRLDGSTKNRYEVVEQFNTDENVQVFLISLKAGGIGLNLTAASAVFLFDPWWNPMAEQQAIDRAHRIGQKETVNIYKFITKNSIEEKILKLQQRKENLFENLVAEDDGAIKKLSWEDLIELFE